MNNQSATVSDKTITDLFEKQKSHLPVLKRRSVAERLRRLRGVQEYITENRASIEAAGYRDFHKPAMEVRAMEIYPVLNELKTIRKNLKRWVKHEKVKGGFWFWGTSSRIVREPKGQVLVISPWNYPFNLSLVPFITALAAGNSVILKPSEYAPATADIIEDLVNTVFDEREAAVLQGEYTMAETLLEQPFNHIVFTGSPQIGRVIMERASMHLADITLELGGKSPALIDTDVKLDKAVSSIVFGKMANAGQTCIAPDYALVPRNRRQKVVDALIDKIQSAYGDNEEILDGKDFARIVNKRHYRRLMHLIDDAVSKGAEIAHGGSYVEGDRYIEPTILTDVPEDAAIMEEEIFGPVLPVVTYNSLDQAIERIRSSKPPLMIYGYTSNRKNADEIISRTSSGSVVINEMFASYVHPELPFGGINQSGIGRLHGRHGFRTLSNEKAVLHRLRGWSFADLLMPPYGRGRQKLARLMMK